MLVPSSSEIERSRPVSPSLLGGLGYEVIKSHLAVLGNLDRRAMLDTLVPFAELPPHDPAGYLIATHRKRSASDPHNLEPAQLANIDSSYELGVVFASSLLRSSVNDISELPVVSDFIPAKRGLVDTYLNKARDISVKKLTSQDSRENGALAGALEVFIKRCNAFMPDLMMDGSDELKRGSHDYLSVIALLEARADQESHLLRQRLGRFTLSRLLSQA